MLTYSEKRGTYFLMPLENQYETSKSLVLSLWHCNSNNRNEWPERKDMWPGLRIERQKMLRIEEFIKEEFNLGKIENLSLSPNEKFYSRESYLFDEGILVNDQRKEYLLEKGNRYIISTNLPESIIAIVTRDKNSTKKLCERFSLAFY
mgnify:CR=1 FL=1